MKAQLGEGMPPQYWEWVYIRLSESDC